MSYLSDYLKVIPKIDQERVMQVIRENEELFLVENLSEDQFEALIKSLVEEDHQATTLVDLGEKVEAAPFNEFFSSLAIDLIQLFEKQNLIEGAARNYDRIYQGNLEEMKRAIDALERRTRDLELENKIEANVIVQSYDFTEEDKKSKFELLTPETSYLFEDRDGLTLNPVELTRTLHVHYGALGKTKRTNRLLNEKNQTTAKIALKYVSPYTVGATNPIYSIEKAIDDSTETFWAIFALAPEQVTDRVSKNP